MTLPKVLPFPVQPIFSLFCAALLCVSAATAQRQVNKGELVEIPRLSVNSPKASHAVVACNEEGDIYVVWSGKDEVTNLTQVEGAFLRRSSRDRWELFDTKVIASGVASGGDCINPDIVAADEDFVVAWTWMNSNSIADGEINCAFIHVPDQNGDASIHSPGGLGYHLADMNPRNCHGMVDLAVNDDNEVVASYASFTGNGVGTANFNFSVEGVVFEFSGSSTANPPQKGTPQKLVNWIPFDEIFADEVTVGRVLPDVVFDKSGKLVLACEAFLDADRDGMPSRQSAIHVSTYKLNNRSLNAEDSILVSSQGIGVGSIKIQQRPGLVQQEKNKVLLAWVEHKGNSDFNQGVLSFASTVKLSGAGITLDPAQLDTVDSKKTREYIVPMQFDGPGNSDNYALRSVRGQSGKKIQKLNVSQGQTWQDLFDFDQIGPWRPAVDVFQESNPFQAITVEGRTPGSAVTSQRIHLWID